MKNLSPRALAGHKIIGRPRDRERRSQKVSEIRGYREERWNTDIRKIMYHVGAKDEKAQDAQQSFVSLYKLVVLKDLVSEFIWYSLVGGLVLTILNNTIEAAEASCTYDPEAAKAMADALAANNKNLDNIANQANEEAENDDFGEEDE